MKKVVFLSLLLLAWPTYAAVLHTSEDFYSCSQDADCTFVPGICGSWTPVNKAKADDAELYFSHENAVSDCDVLLTRKPEHVGCKRGNCAIRPDAQGCLLYHFGKEASLTKEPCCLSCALDKNGFCKDKPQLNETCKYGE